MYKKDVLSNGVRIISKEEKSRASVAIGFWVGVGGRYEDNTSKGIAHFLEHIVFKGSRKYSCENIKQSIEGVGGMLNAFTSDEQTCFYAKVPSKHIEQTFDILADMVFFPRIPKNETEKEKGVIVEELKMYYDLPQYYVLDLLDQLMWSGHILGKALIGSQKTVEAMTVKNLKQFHKNYYTPGNVVISLCGNFSHTMMRAVIHKKLGGLIDKKEKSYSPFLSVQTQGQTRFQFRNIEQMHIALGVHGYDENSPKRYVLALINVILGANMSSRLFVEVREKRGLAYSISSSTKSMHDTGAFVVRAGVQPEKLVESVDVILKEFDKLKQKLVPVNEFKRAKDYLLGQLLMGLEDTVEQMLWMGDGLISRNKIKTLKKVIKAFEAIDRTDIKDISREVFNSSQYSLAVIGSVTEDQKNIINNQLIF